MIIMSAVVLGIGTRRIFWDKRAVPSSLISEFLGHYKINRASKSDILLAQLN